MSSEAVVVVVVVDPDNVVGCVDCSVAFGVDQNNGCCSVVDEQGSLLAVVAQIVAGVVVAVEIH